MSLDEYTKKFVLRLSNDELEKIYKEKPSEWTEEEINLIKSELIKRGVILSTSKEIPSESTSPEGNSVQKKSFWRGSIVDLFDFSDMEASDILPSFFYGFLSFITFNIIWVIIFFEIFDIEAPLYGEKGFLTKRLFNLFVLIVLCFRVGFKISKWQDSRLNKKMEKISQDFILEKQRRAPQDAQLICPHCQKKGFITTWRGRVDDKKPLSSGDLGMARLTGGLSQVFDALDDMRTKYGEFAECKNCGQSWRTN